MRSIYLDYCTSTPVAASVRDSMLPFLSEFYGHPSSSHWSGRAAQEAIEDSRSNVASLIGCHPSEVVFTSGATESVNLGLLGLAKSISKSCSNIRPHLISSKLDHACVQMCANYLSQNGWDVTFVGCDSDGVIDLDEIEDAVTGSTRIVSIIHASHRIGTIQPVEAVAELCQRRDILFHTDASQSVGKIDCNVDHLGVDMLSLSGHKFYAPKGIGALYVRTGVPVNPILFGEGCEAGLRPGTANVPHIVALGQASKVVLAGLESTVSGCTRLRDHFLKSLEQAISKPVKVHGSDVGRLPTIASFELPGVTADAMQRMVPEICLGATATNGNGNSNGKTGNSTHAAMGLTEEQSASTLRVSIGWTTSQEEIEQATRMLSAAYESLLNE